MNSPIHALIWLIAITIYFIPTIIAVARPVRQPRKVAVINLFAFLIVPWVWAMVWACSSDKRKDEQDSLEWVA